MLTRYKTFLDESPAKAILTFVLICFLFTFLMGVSVQLFGVVGWFLYVVLAFLLTFWMAAAGFLIVKRLIQIGSQ